MLPTIVRCCVRTATLVLLIVPPIAGDDDADEPAAVYDYRTWDCRVGRDRFTLTTRHRLTINNPRGKKHAQLALPESNFLKLKNVKIRVLNADGDLLYDRSKGDLLKACGYDRVALYTDVCHYAAELLSSQYPYAIEYEYTLEGKPLFFWRRAVLQTDVPVTEATYRLSVPPNVPFRYRVYGLEAQPVIQPGEKGRQEYVWSVTDIPPRDDLDYLPSSCRQSARIEFMACSFEFGGHTIGACDWNQVAAWYRHLAEGRYASGARASCRSGATDPRVLLAPVLRAVTNRVRYVAIQIGLGGWQPYEAHRTWERGFGDCKDMTTLLVGMLADCRVEAYPCLVQTRGEWATDPDFPSFGFNHVITMAVVGSDTVWLDPTCDNCATGDLPSAIENVPALVITRDAGLLRNTPASTELSNQRRYTKKRRGP